MTQQSVYNQEFIMKISSPRVMIDFNRHIYLVVKEAVKHTHYIQFGAAHIRVKKMANNSRDKGFKDVL